MAGIQVIGLLSCFMRVLTDREPLSGCPARIVDNVPYLEHRET
jgi:hypothetical protein